MFRLPSPRLTRPAAAVDPFCVWTVALWLPTPSYRTLSEMVLRRVRVLLEIGDTMRVLCCLLLGWSTLLSGCGESKEDAVYRSTRISDWTVVRITKLLYRVTKKWAQYPIRASNCLGHLLASNSLIVFTIAGQSGRSRNSTLLLLRETEQP